MQLWGVINLTPNSFFAGSRAEGLGALNRAAQMLADGAAKIDVGAESTRPGAETISATDQLNVLFPFIDQFAAVHGQNNLSRISVDTRDIAVMRACLDKGVTTINDVSGGDDAIYELVGKSGCDYVLMHTKGDPKTMQQAATYGNATAEVLAYLQEHTEKLAAAGAKRTQIIWDTGIGFGKLAEHNLELIARHEIFSAHGVRLLAGVSRKSFIGHFTGKSDPADRLIGTLAVQTYLTLRGLDILRVHDVKEMAETLKVISAIQHYEL
ncbi:dihydropteroate synthase [Turneriella parva]|uniref:dihydropteroate synthase n=1 Tax=Turneriella parva TaxID=29510 RepID=UPI0002F191B9|nr:dihydropteroate synthase [Turneriella parva]